MNLPKFRRTRATDVELEQAVADWADQLQRAVRPSWTAAEPGTNYLARPWDLLICHSTCTLLFPEATAANRGAEIAVLKIGSPTIQIVAVTGTIDGASTSAGPAANRSQVWISSGKGWHSG